MPNRDPEKHRENSRRGVTKMYVGRRARGLCIYCCAPPRPGKQTCPDCAVRKSVYYYKRKDAARQAKDDA